VGGCYEVIDDGVGPSAVQAGGGFGGDQDGWLKQEGEGDSLSWAA